MNFRSVQLIPPRELPFTRVPVAHFSTLPVEITFIILGLLTFRERVTLTRVSKRLRATVFYWPGFVHRLSNEQGRHCLSQVLIPYMRRINGSNVRNVSLSTHRFTVQDRAVATEELSKFVDMLWRYGCHSVREANIQMYCISRYHWMTKFVGIATRSLTTLTLLTAINPNEILSAVQFLLSKFPRLRYLSFGSHLSNTSGNALYSSSPIHLLLSPVFDPYNQVRDGAPWPAVDHTDLRHLCIDSDNGIGDYSRTFFECVPNIRVLSFSGAIFLPNSNSVDTIYQDIRIYCKHLESVIYSYSFNAIYDTQRVESDTVLRNVFVQGNIRTFRVIGRNFSVYTKQHIQAIIATYHKELTKVSIEPPDTDMVGYFAPFQFHRLENATISFKGWPPYPEQEDPWTRLRKDIGWLFWLSYLRSLRHIVLRNMDIMSRDIRRLKDRSLLPNMETMTLNNCRYRVDMPHGEYLVTNHYHEVTMFSYDK